MEKSIKPISLIGWVCIIIILICISVSYYLVALPKQQEQTIDIISKEEPKEFIGILVTAGKLRKCPSKDCEVIKYYTKTAEIKIVGLDDSNEWYQVKPNDDYGNEINGWMHYSLFTEEFRNYFVPDNSNQQVVSLIDKNLEEEKFLEKLLNFLFLFFSNKNNQIFFGWSLIGVIILIGGIIFRKKIKILRKKYVYIIIIVSAVFFVWGGTELEFFIKNKFDKINQQLEESKIETESAQKLAERNAEKAKENLAKMTEAQQEANQERIAKNQKALELAQEQKTQAELAADKDGDGLTYRQEIAYGTSDSNTDSDGDGVPDGQDMHPAGGGRSIAQDFQWNYEGQNWEYTLAIPEDWYEYYKNKPRIPHGTAYVTFNDPYIKEIAQKIKNIATTRGYHLSSFLLSFVQSLPYVLDAYTTFNEYPKYPIETIIEKNGDCEDTAYLLASLIRATDIGVALVEFNNHMGVSVNTVHSQSGYYYSIGEDWYYYYETTGKGFRIGDLPDDYKYQQAKIMVVGGQEIQYLYPQYVKPCEPSSDIAGYYYDEVNYYSDSQCYNLVYCMYYKGYYVDGKTSNLFWDSGCSQVVISGCVKSTSFSSYFTNGIGYYYDSRCTQIARVCRFSYNDYWDGYSHYWDSNCTQRVLSWCGKSTYKSGYFFNSIDSNYYFDNQCTQEVGL